MGSGPDRVDGANEVHGSTRRRVAIVGAIQYPMLAGRRSEGIWFRDDRV